MPNRRLVVVTGATGTLGAALCERLIQQKYYPIAIGRDNDKLRQLADTYRGKLSTYSCDVGDARAVKQLYEQPIFKEGVLQAVVSCAGILTMGATETFMDSDWDETMRVNTSGTFYLFHHALAHMKERGGHLVAIGSRWASGAKEAAAYAASKAALRGLITSLQKEFAGGKIRPVLVAPGSIASPMSSSVNTIANRMDILDPQDVAEAITYILSTPQRVIFNEITIQAYNYDLTDSHAV